MMGRKAFEKLVVRENRRTMWEMKCYMNVHHTFSIVTTPCIFSTVLSST
jgi:hypothetical protein